MSRQKRTRAAQLSTPVSLLYTCPYKLTPLTRCHGHRKLNFTTTIDVIVTRKGKDIDSLDIVCRDGDQIKRMESVYLPERTKVTAFDISPLSVFDVHYPLGAPLCGTRSVKKRQISCIVVRWTPFLCASNILILIAVVAVDF